MGFASGFQAGLSAVRQAKDLRDERKLREGLTTLESEYQKSQEAPKEVRTQAEDTASAMGVGVQSAAPLTPAEKKARAGLGMPTEPAMMSPVVTERAPALGIKPQAVSVPDMPSMSQRDYKERQVALYRKYGDSKMALAMEQSMAADDERAARLDLARQQLQQQVSYQNAMLEDAAQRTGIAKSAQELQGEKQRRETYLSDTTSAVFNAIISGADPDEINELGKEAKNSAEFQTAKNAAYQQFAQESGTTVSELRNLANESTSALAAARKISDPEARFSRYNKLLETVDPIADDDIKPVLQTGSDERGTYAVLTYGGSPISEKFYDDPGAGVMRPENIVTGADKLAEASLAKVQQDPLGFGLQTFRNKQEAVRIAKINMDLRKIGIDEKRLGIEGDRLALEEKKVFHAALSDAMGAVSTDYDGFDITNPQHKDAVEKAMYSLGYTDFSLTRTGEIGSNKSPTGVAWSQYTQTKQPTAQPEQPTAQPEQPTAQQTPEASYLERVGSIDTDQAIRDMGVTPLSEKSAPAEPAQTPASPFGQKLGTDIIQMEQLLGYGRTITDTQLSKLYSAVGTDPTKIAELPPRLQQRYNQALADLAARLQEERQKGLTRR